MGELLVSVIISLFSCATVEVYSSETSQWHTADSLPVPCCGHDLCHHRRHLVPTGGKWYWWQRSNHCPVCVLLLPSFRKPPHLLSSPASASVMSVWKTLPDTPLKNSAAASMSGNLLAVGGYKKRIPRPASPAVYVFSPSHQLLGQGHHWEIYQSHAVDCTAVQLSSNQLLVVGGVDDQERPTKTVFLGSITLL